MTNPRYKEDAIPAYFVIDLDIHDAVGFQEYRRRVNGIVEKYDACYLVAAAEFREIVHLRLNLAKTNLVLRKG